MPSKGRKKKGDAAKDGEKSNPSIRRLLYTQFLISLENI
jgi:hypothetical protein